MKALSPRERRQARTKEEILSAALAIINEKGPQNLTLRALARRVDYSPAGIYEYFDSKDDIIEAVCAEGDLRLQRYLESVPSGLSADDHLVELGLAYIQFAVQHRDHFLLMFSNVGEGPEVPFEGIKTGGTFGIVLEAVQNAVDSGHVLLPNNLLLLDVAYGLWATAHGMAMLQVTNLTKVQYDFARVDRAMLRSFVSGLAHKEPSGKIA